MFNFSLFRICRKYEISFDIVAETGNIVAKNGNNVEATFDIVERIVQLVAFDNVAWTLLLVWTGLKSPNFRLNREVSRHASYSAKVLRPTRHSRSLRRRSYQPISWHSTEVTTSDTFNVHA